MARTLRGGKDDWFAGVVTQTFLVLLVIYVLFALFFRPANPYVAPGLESGLLMILFVFFAATVLLNFHSLAARVAPYLKAKQGPHKEKRPSKAGELLQKAVGHLPRFLKEDKPLPPEKLISYTFQAMLFLFLLLLLLDQFYPKEVESRVDFTFLMAIIILLGALSIWFPPKEKQEKKKPGKVDYVMIGVLAVLGTGLIYVKLGDLGWPGQAIALLGGLLIFFLSLLVLSDEDEEKEAPFGKRGSR